MVASTMLKGGFSNTTLQYADVSSTTRTCGADSDMFHGPWFGSLNGFRGGADHIDDQLRAGEHGGCISEAILRTFAFDTCMRLRRVIASLDGNPQYTAKQRAIVFRDGWWIANPFGGDTLPWIEPPLREMHAKHHGTKHERKYQWMLDLLADVRSNEPLRPP